ncbi:MAG: hypothetical protein HKL96_12530 [Phycisphaerales bacterium]|nr:hypothetical protein [Phycisphaerales bacterium]
MNPETPEPESQDVVEQGSPEICISVIIENFDDDPECLAEALGIRPFKLWRKGDLCHPKLLQRRKSNGLEVYFEITNEPRPIMDDVLQLAISPFLERLDVFDNLPQHSQVRISGAVFEPEQRTAFRISPATMCTLARMRASFNMDIYRSSDATHV